MTERSNVYPGSFRPFHNDHLANVKDIVGRFPEDELIILVASEKGCRDGFLTAEDALKVVELSLVDADLLQQADVRLAPKGLKTSLVSAAKALKENGVGRIFSGSKETLGFVSLLIERGLWQGEIVELKDGEIHGFNIRELIKKGDASWKNLVSESSANYIEYILKTRGGTIAS